MGIPWARNHRKCSSAALEGPLTWCFLERMTRFELATLTLAKKGYDDRPYSPSSALQYSTVRQTVRPVRLSRPVRIPLYHHTRAMYLQLIKHLPNDHSACAMIVFMR